MDSYSKSGVNLKLAYSVKSSLPQLLKKATRPEVLGKVGAFGGLFKASFRGYRDPVLVSSMDGVGTKLKVAVDMNCHHTVGQDLVNHCCNDIAVMGATPLFFLDYIGTGKLDKKTFNEILTGLAKGCSEAHVALLGGETAQMPGFYAPGDYDLVGTIVGVVERSKILDGSAIRKGDLLIGLGSTGLHTNGYSLARKVLFDQLKLKVTSRPTALNGKTLGQALLSIHRNYAPFLSAIRKQKLSLHAASHITGGGFEENIERIMPRGMCSRIRKNSWKVPELFQMIQTGGRISSEEMHRVFNMGIGMVLIIPPQFKMGILKLAAQHRIPAYEIGIITQGKHPVQMA